MPTYKLEEGNLQWRFQQSRAKIQLFGGGFGNGKTTAAVIKALTLAKDYPGSNGLIARSTYPKLNDTIRKEFKDWCPSNWVKSFTLEPNQCVLTNGTIINFRYIQQQGKSTGTSSSNLLSATFDWIVVDQIEDPEISEKDFLDLLGRLRGSTPYAGEDDTMPSSGPRWLIAMCNPTRNWVYRKLVKPLHDNEMGIPNPDLMIDPQTDKPIVQLFEGSTYENRDNLPEDFITTQETLYTGQMRQRYLMGEWGAFEGLVYPQYDPSVHMLSKDVVWDYFERLFLEGFRPTLFEAYDHGIAKPSCYGLWFADHRGNVFLLDGFYEKEQTIEELSKAIWRIRQQLVDGRLIGPDYEWDAIYADPAVFKRVSGNSRTVGVSVAGLFSEHGIDMQRANNDIVGGIAKVQSYLTIDPLHDHPTEQTKEAPRLYFNSDMTFIDNEFVDYYWKKDSAGEYTDEPTDKNDHGMDMLKYALSRRPRLAQLEKPKVVIPKVPLYWGERRSTSQDNMRNYRYGN